MILKKYCLYPGNFIHPTAFLGEGVVMGRGNYIGPYCIIYDGVEMGDDNTFLSHVSVGSPPEHKHPDYDFQITKQLGKVIIGSNNKFREFSTINKPTTEAATIIGNNIYSMARVHFGHDSIVEDDVVLSANAEVGGFVTIMKGSVMGVNSSTFQRIVLGSYSMVGMNATVLKSFPPGFKLVGVPATDRLGPNKIGLERNKITIEELEKEKLRWEELCEKRR